jgi:hypothetical protein
VRAPEEFWPPLTYTHTASWLLKFEYSGMIYDLITQERFVVFTPVTMKNAVFLDIKLLFVPHRRHIMSPLQSTGG